MLALVGVSNGCADDELPLPPVVWEGQTIRVRMDDPTIEVCGGTYEALDRHAVLVRETLLIEDDGLIEYSIGDAAFVHQRCEGAIVDNPAGCAFADGTIFTHYPFHPHEIVHSVRDLDPEVGDLSSAFEEGLATLLGSAALGPGTVPLEAVELFNDEHLVDLRDYYRAGRAMALLFDEVGPEAFRRFDVLARSAGENEAFHETFGETLEAFAERIEAEPLCDQSQWFIPLLECDGEPIERSDEEGLVFTGDLSCGQPGVQGPERGRMWTSRHFRLDQATSVLSYSIDMPEDATLEIVGCDATCPDRFAYSGGVLQVGSVLNRIPKLEPGDYFLRLSRPVSTGTGDFEIVLD